VTTIPSPQHIKLSVSGFSSCVEIPHESYTLKEVFMYDTHVKSKDTSQNFKMLQSQIKDSSYTGWLLDKKKNQNAEHSLGRDCMKLMLCLNIPLENPLDDLQRR
jgi:hypothetical protein